MSGAPASASGVPAIAEPALANARWRFLNDVLDVGQRFRFTGPPWSRWWPDKPGNDGWRPCAYTEPPGSENSERISAEDAFIDFGRVFTVLESGEFGRFRSARVVLNDDGVEGWVNTAKFTTNHHDRRQRPRGARWWAWVGEVPPPTKREAPPTTPQNPAGSGSSGSAKRPRVT